MRRASGVRRMRARNGLGRNAAWLLGACMVLLAACATRASRSDDPPMQSANPRAGVVSRPTTTSTQTSGSDTPQMMIVEPDRISLTEQRNVALWTQESMTQADQLAAALSAAGGPNCPAAREHLRAVCDLAERICTIASRHPSDDDLEARCEESRERCATRTEEVQRRCGGS